MLHLQKGNSPNYSTSTGRGIGGKKKKASKGPRLKAEAKAIQTKNRVGIFKHED